jgi:hypothetical protein
VSLTWGGSKKLLLQLKASHPLALFHASSIAGTLTLYCRSIKIPQFELRVQDQQFPLGRSSVSTTVTGLCGITINRLQQRMAGRLNQ